MVGLSPAGPRIDIRQPVSSSLMESGISIATNNLNIQNLHMPLVESPSRDHGVKIIFVSNPK
jgi:hypothetical protein